MGRRAAWIGVVAMTFTASWCASRAAPADDPAPGPAALAKELPRIPPRSPVEALVSFRIEDGFEIQLAAAEPDVIDPVALAFDEDGRMFVVEMRDYPFEPGKGQSAEQDARAHAGRVRLLEDVDGDSRVDRSTVFADGLSWPTGVLPWKGGVFVTAAPDILFLKDEDGDGVADRREVVYTGFGRQNVQGLLNTPRWGLDNRIWVATGTNGGDVTDGRGSPPISLRGRDVRFAPGDRAAACGPLEPATGGGQFGMSFDDWGNRFVCSNSNHVRLVALESRYLDRNAFFAGPTATIDIAEDGAAAPVFRASAAEPWRLVRTRWRAASAERSRFAATELVPIGFFTSATGILVYRGDAFPPEYRGNAFIGDVGGNLVHRKLLEPRGTVFTARRPEKLRSGEFLTSSDNWFRPVSLTEAPDGTLYVCDMYRETIEHPFSIPDSIKQFLDLKSGDDRGRIWRIVPRGFSRRPRPRLSRATSSELAGLLDGASSWQRETAQRLLVERGGHEADERLRSMARESPRPLARLHALCALDGLQGLLASDVERALADPEPGVREAAARLAERFLGPTAASGDPLARKLRALAGDAEIRVRMQAALALGADRGDEGLSALLEIARRDAADEWVRAAVLSSSADRAGRLLAALLDASSSGAARPGGSWEPLVTGLASIAGARNDRAEIAAALVGLSKVGGDDAERIRVAGVLGLGEGLERAGRSLSAMLTAPPPELEAAASAIEPLFAVAAGRAVARELSEADRVEATRLLASARFPVAFEALSRLLDAREPRALQLAALRAIGSFDRKEVGALLVERWRTFSPSVRREAAEALVQRTDRITALLDGVAAGAVAPADLDPEKRAGLLKHADSAIRARAVALLKLEASSDRKAVIDRYRGALEKPGDAERGRVVFRRVCATCHRLGGEGHVVAPDFNTVRDRTAESLLVHLLDPNREVSPAYVVYSAVTADGRVATGIIAAETGSSITFRRAEAVEETVLRSRIDRLESSGLSLMPEGLENDLSVDDVADLIAAVQGG